MPIPHVRISGDSKQHRIELSQKVNKLLLGYHNEVHDLTLTANQATTRFPAGALLLDRITPDTVAVIMPVHFNASTLMAAAPYPYSISNVGYITFYHAAIAAANQDFKLVLFGD
jgi:hypothetical protein